jgi:hypothetical protein
MKPKFMNTDSTKQSMLQGRGVRYLLSSLALFAVASILGVAALADAPDPKLPPQTPTAQVIAVTHNDQGTPSTADDTTTVTVTGGWVWTTHHSDCNTDRAGAGFAVDWNDPDDPGFVVTTLNGVTIDVGSSVAVNGNAVDNVVHPTPGAVQFGGSGKDTDVALPSQWALWRGGCGTDTRDLGGDSNNDPEGIWGPRAHVLNASGVDTGSQTGITHTYRDTSIANGLQICALMYDVHTGTAASHNGGVGITNKASEITAGGSGHNGDNSAEKNGNTPVGNACVPIAVPLTSKVATFPSVIPNDTGTVTGSNPTGTLKFELFGPGDTNCTGTPAYTQTVSLTNGSATTSNSSFTASTLGLWKWRLTYSGDSVNTGKVTACGIESFQITGDTPDVSVRTDIHNSSHAVISAADAGTVVHDKVFVTKTAGAPTLPNPSGNVIFHRYSTIDCSGTPVNQTVALGADGTAESSTTTVAGDMSYRADYQGDASYPARSGACEPLSINTSTPCPAGSFKVTMQPNGDAVIVFDQFPAPNDNSYGVNSVGWKPNRPHRFKDLVNSDHAGFTVTQNGAAKLDFNIDYLTQTTVSGDAPSGYASLGPFGGDGAVNTGTLTTSDLTWDTSFSRDLNDLGYFVNGVQTSSTLNGTNGANLLVDSPPTLNNVDDYTLKTPNPWNGTTTYPENGRVINGWDFHDTYFVTIKASKLIAMGAENAATHQLNPGWAIGPNADALHNSPPKDCP